MTRANLQSLTVDELVQRFASLALEQDEALLDSDISKVNRVYWRLKAVEAELKGRQGDHKRCFDATIIQMLKCD
jgi:Domain of unknown function (DUF2019)